MKTMELSTVAEFSFLGDGEGDDSAEECVLTLTLGEDEALDLIADLFNALRKDRKTNPDTLCVQISLRGDIQRIDASGPDRLLPPSKKPRLVPSEARGPVTSEARGPVTSEARGPITSEAKGPVPPKAG
jgi:hypothetical protein